MGGSHGFDAVGDDFAAGQGILHPLVPHGDAVADRNGVELVRHTAGFADRVADDLSDLLQVAVTGNNIGVGVADADERAFDLFGGNPGGAHQGAVRGAFEPLLHGIAAHFQNSPGCFGESNLFNLP